MKIDLSNLSHLNKKLTGLAEEIEAELEVEFTVTSEFRPGDEGVHGYGRGLDWRCHNDEFGKFVEDYINARWQYDPSRPDMKVCMYHDVGQGKHLHLQVHPNTVVK